MGGKTKSKSTSTQSSVSGSAQAWAQPYANAGAKDVQNVYNQAQPGLQSLTSMIQGNIVPGLQQQANASGQVAGQGNQYLSDVLGGKYMSGNPYLQNVIDASSGDIMGNVNSMFSRNGRYGSEAHQQVAMRELGNLENQMRFSDYTNQQNRMDQAAQFGAQANNANNSQLLAAIAAGAELPYTGTTNLANSLGALFNGGTSQGQSTSIEKGPGLFSSLLSGAAQGATMALAASERRVKDNIVKVGEFGDGLGKYRYTYKPGYGLPKGEFIGVMVDEVQKLRPWALGPVMNGIQTVNYGAL